MPELPKSVFAITVIIGLLLIFTLIALVIIQDNERSQIAVQHGCEYLGTARDLNKVVFFKCNDDIVMKPVGQYP